MFVVVVAVDSRWLTSALTDRVIALRPSSAIPKQATPQDYLKKIFQLLFWVQPLPTEGRARLVHGLLSDSIRIADGSAPPRRPGRPLDGLQVGPRERELADSMLARYGAEVRLDTSPLVLA